MRELVPVRPEVITCRSVTPGNPHGQGTALDLLATRIPDILDAICRIAEQTAATNNAVKMIEAECLQITTGTIDFVQRQAECRRTIRDQGEIVLEAMREVHRQLADSDIPEAARLLLIQQVPMCIKAVLAAVDCKEGQR